MTKKGINAKLLFALLEMSIKHSSLSEEFRVETFDSERSSRQIVEANVFGKHSKLSQAWSSQMIDKTVRQSCGSSESFESSSKKIDGSYKQSVR